MKKSWKMKYRGYNLNLKGAKPETERIVGQIQKSWKKKPFYELVFCGYGEPTMELSRLLEICRSIRKAGPDKQNSVPSGIRIRLNTIGLGSLIWKRDIAKDLKGNIDAVHISLNTADSVQWIALMRPLNGVKKNGYKKALEFTRACAKVIPETIVTAVENPVVDIEACRRLAEKMGAGFRVRPALGAEQQ